MATIIHYIFFFMLVRNSWSHKALTQRGSWDFLFLGIHLGTSHILTIVFPLLHRSKFTTKIRQRFSFFNFVCFMCLFCLWLEYFSNFLFWLFPLERSYISSDFWKYISIINPRGIHLPYSFCKYRYLSKYPIIMTEQDKNLNVNFLFVCSRLADVKTKSKVHYLI